MEREMVSAYKQAIERASTDQKAVVRREHVQWFNRYARACDAVPAAERRDCITRELRNRTEELRGSGNRTALPDGTLKPYRVGQGVFPPAVLSKVEPLYSDQARNAKLQGNVLVQLVVDEHGLPRQIRVMRSLGMGLDEKAVEAVQRWRFRPGMKDGHAVSVQATIEVNFRLL
jgi:TonB family protein